MITFYDYLYIRIYVYMLPFYDYLQSCTEKLVKTQQTKKILSAMSVNPAGMIRSNM